MENDSASADQYDEKGNAKHYQQNREGFGPIDMMIKIWGMEATRDYCEMTAFKYRLRIGHKVGQPIEQELIKAGWYERKAKELTDHLM